MLKFLKGFVYAFSGLVVFFRHERNGKIQLAVGVIVVACGFGFQVAYMEWIVLSACIAIVLAFEMMNSALEKLCNLVHPQYHPAVKIVKDMAAGAVLWVSVFSAVAGAIIFLPKILQVL